MMKKSIYLLSIPIIWLLLILCGIHPERYKSNSFHVRIGCEMEGMPFAEKLAYDYPIYFTNNNWATETPIMTTFDVSNNWSGGNDVVHQEWLTNSDSTIAIKFSKSFKSYTQCVKYNDSVIVKYHKLQAYRDKHEIKQVPQKEEDCCKSISIK